ncbi:MAG TPA: hypothetical protein VHP11_07475, partial [Tepidisphaeraceae bacterium]|nr:hypothetical protein [Tepidisphaeraceae bacterium]
MQDAESGQPQKTGAQNEFVVDDEVQTPPEPSREELDGMRIRRIAEMRRSACRSASYCIIGALACWVMAVQLVWLWVCHVWVGG